MTLAQQISFLDVFDDKRLIHHCFSHENVCPDSERLAIEERYSPLFIEDNRFSRKVVSFQANKGEIVHGWIKYREGFSAQLVEILLKEFHIQPGEKVLDPFAGSATTLLVAKTRGIYADGIELLPNCHLAWETKLRYSRYNLQEIKDVLSQLQNVVPDDTSKSFPHIPITASAFPPETERDIMFFSQWFDQLEVSSDAKVLLKLILTSILEEVSYTRKDGQYLRWDYRSQKVTQRNAIRQQDGKKLIKKIDKGTLPSVKDALQAAIQDILEDISVLQNMALPKDSEQKLINGSTLEILPTLETNTYAGVITSPPYANRYDYTRTYALELAYLGVGQEINHLRQRLLSCTVESKSKVSILRAHYEKLGLLDRYEFILNTIQANRALEEINYALHVRWDRGEMNNRGVLPMINQYFTELGFIFAELFRVCRSGAQVAFVNDNTRYGGEIIPVDTLTTNIAESLGFEPVKIYVLSQKKGNSSQQMGKFGRAELRKSITIWRKP